MSSPEQIKLIQTYYIAYYGRPADNSGLAFWLDELALGRGQQDLIADFGSSTQGEFQAQYPSGTPEDFFSNLYLNILNRGPDASGLAFWVGKFNDLVGSGLSSDQARAKLVIEFVGGIKPETPWDFLVLQNKLTLAIATTEAAGGLNASAESELINSVRDGAFKDLDINKPSVLDFYMSTLFGSPITLTAGVDNPESGVSGTAGADRFEAPLALWNAGSSGDVFAPTLGGADEIYGGQGRDTLNATLNDFFGQRSGNDPIIQDVEVINFRVRDTAGSDSDVSVDFRNVNGVEELWMVNSDPGSTLAVENVQDPTAIGMRNLVDASFSVTYDADALGDDEASQSVVLNNVTGTGEDSSDLIITSAGDDVITDVSISATGTNKLVLGVYDDSGEDNTLVNLEVTGTGSLVLRDDDCDDFANLERIDARTNSGGLDIVTDSDNLKFVAGGAGSDTFLLTGTVTMSEITLGEGDNELRVADIGTSDDDGITGLTVTAGAGDDRIYLGASDNDAEGDLIVNAGAGDNIVDAYAMGDVSVTTLGGEDDIRVHSAGSDITINAGDGPNDIDAYGEGEDTDVLVNAGTGDDSVFVYATGDATVNAGAGDNFVDVIAGGNVSVTTLGGDDFVQAASIGEDSGNVTVNAGAGNNFVSAVSAASDSLGPFDFVLADGDVSVTTGNGNDTILAGTSDGDITINAGGGVNYVLAATTSGTVNLTGGSGNNTGDHFDVTWASLTAEGSSVAMGGGFNTLGILDGTAEDLVELTLSDGSPDVLTEEWLNAFGLADLSNVTAGTGTGNVVQRLELLNAFDISDDVTLDVSGLPGTVGQLYFGDVQGEDGADFTIVGMGASTPGAGILIQSADNFDLSGGGEDGEPAGRLTVEDVPSITIHAGIERATFVQDESDEAFLDPLALSTDVIRAGTWSAQTGRFVPTEAVQLDTSADVKFNLGTGNAVLTSLNVAAGDEIDVYISNNDDSVAFDIGAVRLYSRTDDADLIIGDNVETSVTIDRVMIEGGDDADLNIFDNSDSTITIGDVSLLSIAESEGGDLDDADVFVQGNVNSDITLGNVLVSGGGSFESIDFEFSDNDNTNLTVDSIELTSVDGGDAALYISDNDFTDPEDRDGDMTITVNGAISVQADVDASFEIYDNDDFDSLGNDLVIDLKGAVDVTSNDGSANMEFDSNNEATIHVRGAVNIESNASDAEAELYVADNDGSTIRFYDTVTVKAESTVAGTGDVSFTVEDHDDASVRFDGKVTLQADEYIYVDISYNDDSSVRLLGGLEATAGGDIDIDIVYNYSALTANANTVEIAGIKATSTSDGSVDLYIYDNDDAKIKTGNIELSSGSDGSASLDVSYNGDSLVEIGTVDMTAGTVEFDISDNNGSTIDVGIVTMAATGRDAYFDVYASDDETITIEDVTVRAEDDVFFNVRNFDVPVALITLGDIEVRAGTVWDESTESWSDSDRDWARVEFFMDNVEGTETILLQTNEERGSRIDADISDTADLHTITMVGGNSDATSTLEVYGSQGNKDGVFTIDMSDLISDVWVRTVTNDTNSFRDNVVNFADFSDAVVNVLIGSGDTEYNVESVSNGYLFAGSANGYVSTGERDLTPVAKVMTFGAGVTDVSDGESATYNVTLTLNGNNYGFSVTFTDPSDEGEGEGEGGLNTWSLDSDPTPEGYTLAINSSSGLLTLTGLSDGTDFSASMGTAVLSSFTGSVANSYNYGTGSVTVNPVQVSDGRGLEEREIFTFTGNDIGDVVIGGFNPGVWNTVSPINNQITDRLDFSQFDNDKVSSLDDLIFSIDSDGPFANVVITFTDETLEEGSITLVGVGEYDNAIALVQGSIIF